MHQVPNFKSPLIFDWEARTRLISGPGALSGLGTLAAALGGRRALLVTDHGIVAAGHTARALASLEAAGLAAVVDDGVRENPTTADVARCLAIAQAGEVDIIVGLGGGSSMDTAKGCNFLLTNGGEMKDYWGVGKAALPMLPLIAIPTTAGTGSECQSAALIADETTHQKMACLDPKAAARVAILDPEITLSQPPRVAACTGIDAIAHAVESAVTRKRNAVSSAFSSEAFRLCIEALPRVLAHPGDIEARGRMQLGAAFAGIAIEASMLGAAHSAANPLTAHYDIVHGEAVGLMLPGVIRFNTAGSAEAAAIYAGLAGSGERLAAQIADLTNDCGLARLLTPLGVRKSDIPMLSEEAARQWTANFNPREITATDFARLYEELI